MVICPYCEQDDVWEVAIVGAADAAFMCLECDTVWATGERIEDGFGTVFHDFMPARNLPEDWSLVKKLRKLE
jgi:hypothetical protein